jgi:hypothetical protein
MRAPPGDDQQPQNAAGNGKAQPGLSAGHELTGGIDPDFAEQLGNAR